MNDLSNTKWLLKSAKIFKISKSQKIQMFENKWNNSFDLKSYRPLWHFKLKTNFNLICQSIYSNKLFFFLYFLLYNDWKIRTNLKTNTPVKSKCKCENMGQKKSKNHDKFTKMSCKNVRYQQEWAAVWTHRKYRNRSMLI